MRRTGTTAGREINRSVRRSRLRNRALLTVAVLAITLLVHAAPVSAALQGSIEAELAPPSTFYTANVIDSGGSPLTYEWTADLECGVFTTPAPTVDTARWDHPQGDPPDACPHESPSHAGTITVKVTNQAGESVYCTYSGSLDGEEACVAPADLRVEKTGSPETVLVGETITYTIRVTNEGPGTAKSATLDDDLPADVEGVLATTTQGECDPPQAGLLHCDLGDIPPDGTVTVTVTAVATETGTLVNDVTVASESPDEVPGNNFSAASTEVLASADLQVTKTGPEEVKVGEEFTYTITVTNNGPDDAVNVIVSDDLDGKLDFVSATPECVPPPIGTGRRCSLGTLAAGTNAAVEILVRAVGIGVVSNVAQVQSETADPDLHNNSNVETPFITEIVAGSADLQVTKTGPAQVALGELFTYTLTVTNNGPDAAHGVKLQDFIDHDEVELISASTTAGVCELLSFVRCNVMTLAAQESFQVQVVVKATELGQASNTFEVVSDTPDPLGGNNDNEEDPFLTEIVAGSADLQVTKTGPAQVALGEEFTYLLTVTNNGPGDALSVRLTDFTDDEVELVSAFSTANCEVFVNTGVVVCNAETLAANESFQVQVVVRATEPGQASNIVQVVSQDNPDPNEANNTNAELPFVTEIVPGSADLRVTKEGPSEVKLGEEFTYLLTVTNNGPDAAHGVELTDLIDEELDLLSAFSTEDCGVFVNIGSVICNVETLAAHASFQVQVVVKAKELGQASNIVEVESFYTPDPNEANNSNEELPFVTEIVPLSADLQVTKEGPEEVELGDEFTYLLTVTNNGPDAAQGVEMTDLIDDELDLLSAFSTEDCGVFVNIGSVICNVETLAAHASFQVQIVVEATELGEATNIVFVTSDTDDPNEANNTNEEQPLLTNILPEPDGLRSRIEAVRDDLGALVSDKQVAKALGHLTKALDDENWLGEDPTDKKRKKVFDEVDKAIKELLKIKKPPTVLAGAQAAIADLVAGIANYTEELVDEAADEGGKPKEIEKAQKELDKAAQELAKGKPDKAIEHYRKACEHAEKAMA